MLNGNEKKLNLERVKAVANPPIDIIGIPAQILPARPASVGFVLAAPNGDNLAVLFDVEHAEMFVSDMIIAIRKMSVSARSDA
jgi:hypothetical protein